MSSKAASRKKRMSAEDETKVKKSLGNVLLSSESCDIICPKNALYLS